MKKLALLFVVLLTSAISLPAIAQDGDCGERIVCGPEDGSGGGTGCWNCVPDCCWNLFCGGVDDHCEAAGDDEAGEGIDCTQSDPIISGCHYCSTSGGACLNTDVHG